MVGHLLASSGGTLDLWAPCGHTARQPLVVTLILMDLIDVDIYQRRSDKMIGNMSYNWPWSIKIFLYRIRFSLRAWTGLHENSYVGEFSPLSR